MQRVMPTWEGALTWEALTCEGGGAWNRGGSCHAFQSARGWQLVHINILEHHLLLILLQEFLLLLVSRTCPEQRHHGMSIFGQNPQDLSKP